MRIVGKPRDSEIIPPGCSGFATIGPANLNFFRHQGAGLLSFAFEHGMVNRLTPGVATGGGRSSAMTRRMPGTIPSAPRPRPSGRWRSGHDCADTHISGHSLERDGLLENRAIL